MKWSKVFTAHETGWCPQNIPVSLVCSDPVDTMLSDDDYMDEPKRIYVGRKIGAYPDIVVIRRCVRWETRRDAT